MNALDQKITKEAGPLYIREWLVVYLFLFILLTIAALAYSKKQAHIAPVDTIDVTIVGAVSAQKKVTLHSLSTVADVLWHVSLSDDADINKLMLDDVVKPGIFIIPKKQMTSIYVTGEVDRSGVYQVPENCRFNELVNYLPLLQSADSRYFSRKRRIVVEGEEIKVPKRSANVKNPI